MDVFLSIEQLFARYGYLVLLMGLPLDAVASPVPPGNMTLTYTGYLSYRDILDWRAAVVFAWLGSAIGITVTYWLGRRIGQPLLERYGKWLLLRPNVLRKMERVYEQYGNRALLFSFFVPGIRQIAGYFSGMLRMPFSTFALYAYIGAFVWVSVFIGLGYVFGEQWRMVFGLAGRYFWWIGMAVVAVAAAWLLGKSRMRT